MRAFADIGGCPETLVPDNTKTGVSEANYWDPVLNRSYQALARHNEVAIVPARVRKPRDKATPMDPSICKDRNRKFVDSLLQETGFELLVPP